MLKLLDNLVDESDVDLSLPQNVHAFQSALAMKNIMQNDVKNQKISDFFSAEEYANLPEWVKDAYETKETIAFPH